MNPTLRNVLSVIAALFIGGIINAGIIKWGAGMFPVPEGVDPNDIESIKANAHLYNFSHFIMPFIAHAMGTLVGAYAVSRFAASRHKMLALIIGGFFFLGGLTMAIFLPEFWKYSIGDLLLAYFPMALIGWKLAGSPN